MSVHQDEAFFKVFGAVLGALVIFTISIAFLANMFSEPASGIHDPLVRAQLEQRLRPVGQSRIAQ